MSHPAPEPASVLTVIPCLNEAAHIAALIAHLLADPANTRIVVADGGSTDGTRAIVRRIAAGEPRVTLLDNPGRIQSAGINRAVARFGREATWLARIDAHALYPECFVARLIATAEAERVDSVVVRMETRAASGFARGVAAAQNSRLGTGGAAHRSGAAGGLVDHGHHALMRIAAFRAAGGYCETMPCNEDAELDLRLGALGSRIWLAPDLPVTYFPRTTARALARQYWRYGKGRATTMRRHRRMLKPRQALPLAVAPACVAALAAPLYPALALPAAGWAALCQGWGLALALRARRADVALAGSAAMIMHAAWSAGYWKQEIAARMSGGRSVPAPVLPFAAS
ncbi:glycosyltransferase family 2 protein [Erythrobacter donghaensis]|jgi:succinoglycan biosynthesis protein ExoA|uniref:glycosyltransferase family 2 protein n=1 Tax=Erythrobacter donghaensis TaxID=267135 RepID=UPI00093EC33D|nr:glycosyltransferase family 2 protein [Erythrobacter donghaensis]